MQQQNIEIINSAVSKAIILLAEGKFKSGTRALHHISNLINVAREAQGCGPLRPTAIIDWNPPEGEE